MSTLRDWGWWLENRDSVALTCDVQTLTYRNLTPSFHPSILVLRFSSQPSSLTLTISKLHGFSKKYRIYSFDLFCLINMWQSCVDFTDWFGDETPYQPDIWPGYYMTISYQTLVGRFLPLPLSFYQRSFSRFPRTESQMTPSQMATSPSQRVQRGGPAPTQTLPPNRPWRQGGILGGSSLGGGFKYCLCSSLLGEMSQFDKYFSDGLKPPTRNILAIVWGGSLHKTSRTST